MTKRSSKIIIKNLSGTRILTKNSIKKIVKKILKAEACPGQDLSIAFVSDAEIRKFNKKYKGKNCATDVLAFSMNEGMNFLGDIIISSDAARRQARVFNSNFSRELKLYVIHGLLHLLGYDDETKKDFESMKKRQERFLT